jgi:hypothetical protein
LHFQFLIYKIFSSFPLFLLNPHIQEISKCVEMAGSSSHQIKNICVFGGSSPGKEKEFLESANHLAQVLAERKIHLVYGGGSLGLLGGCVNSCIFMRQSSFGGRPQGFSKRGSP